MPPRSFTVQLPKTAGLDQNAEWCILERDGEQRRIRFHDYSEIFDVPGLYEHLFYEQLKCQSPHIIRTLLAEVLAQRSGTSKAPETPTALRVLDVGAGNGMVGEELSELGAEWITGVDILESAKTATERDRPGVYQDYRVIDLTDVPQADHEALSAVGFNALTSVAALGFGDIPPAAFAQAYNYVRSNGLIAFTIKDRFVGDEDQSGFARLIKQLLDGNFMTKVAERRYRHRLAISGEPLYYYAYVAEKHDDVPTDWH